MRHVWILAAVLVASVGPACAGAGSGQGDGTEEEAVTRSIEEVQEARTPAWMEIDGVTGTGIGLCDEEPCIVVFVARRTEAVEEAIPERVEGYRVRIEPTGDVRIQEPRND